LFAFAETRKPDLGGPFFVEMVKNLFVGCIIYIFMMAGVLYSRASTGEPATIAALALIFVAWRYYRFTVEFVWETLPFEQVVQTNKRKGGDYKPERKGETAPYVQPELLGDSGIVVPSEKKTFASTDQLEGPSIPGPLPNLNGVWLCERVEGDPGTFMAEMGQGWAVLTMASMGSGVAGRQRMMISQNGNDFTITCKGAREWTQNFTAGAGVQMVASAEGRDMAAIPTIVGGCLRLEMDNRFVRSFYLEHGKLAMNCKNLKGTSVTWIHTKS
jgi:hypothetical protein